MKLCKSSSAIEKIRMPGILLSLIMILLVFPAVCFSDEGPSSEIVNVAEEGLAFIKANFSIEQLQRLGFKSQQEINEATLGEGFQMYTVYQNVLLDESNKDLHAMSVPLDRWRFPVKSSERCIVLVDIGLLNGKWTFCGIGEAGLVQKIDALTKTWPKTEGNNFRIILIQKTPENYIAITQAEQVIGFLPMRSADNDFTQQDLKGSAEILAELR